MAMSFKPTAKVTRLRGPNKSAKARDKIVSENRKVTPRRRSGRHAGGLPTSPVIIDLAHERERRKRRHEERPRRADGSWLQIALIVFLIVTVVLWTWL